MGTSTALRTSGVELEKSLVEMAEANKKMSRTLSSLRTFANAIPSPPPKATVEVQTDDVQILDVADASGHAQLERTPSPPVEEILSVEYDERGVPLAFAHIIANKSALQGKGQPFNVRALMDLIPAVYADKALSDSVNDAQHIKRVPLPEFLIDFFNRRYGIRTLSEVVSPIFLLFCYCHICFILFYLFI
jgi:hypothetical protein